MDGKPLLIFPQPTRLGRKKKDPFPVSKSVHTPNAKRQGDRFNPIFQRLNAAFEARRVELQNNPLGLVPEKVLVLETIGSVKDFIKVVRLIPGLDWLAEWSTDDILPDEDYYDKKTRDKVLKGRLFLVMSDQQALRELLALWQRYQKQPKKKFQHGWGKWLELFAQLHDIRSWDVQDRLADTGVLGDWAERVQSGDQTVRFEMELWFRSDSARRDQAGKYISDLVQGEGGKVRAQSVVSEIAYHGILGELPIAAIKKLQSDQNTQLLRCDYVMHFRPVGQCATRIYDNQTVPDSSDASALIPPQKNQPVVALLDGLPLVKHKLLDGRLLIDDPDGWSPSYLADERNHGTAMASLITHGELDDKGAPLERVIYVRPILKPHPYDRKRIECVPEEELPIDLIHRAVRRLFEPENGAPPIAPNVRIINLSVGDPSQLFDRYLSPWARLLDWLSWKYNVLFIVSAGNHLHDIELDVPRPSLLQLSAAQIETASIQAIDNDLRHRRLLSPSEAINVLTIAAAHHDSAGPAVPPRSLNPYQSPNMPSPINAIGLGYRRSIKPDLLFPGGRQLFDEKPGNTHAKAIIQVKDLHIGPGQKVASPGSTAGALDSCRYTRGTSNAAALATRGAANIYETIQLLRDDPDGHLLRSEFDAVLLKTLLVHGASWEGAVDVLVNTLKADNPGVNFKEYVARYLGFGHVQLDKTLRCTDQRVTLLGCGYLEAEDAHLYSMPLPPSLSGKKIWRRLTITLTWLSSCNSYHQQYRRASLWFDPPAEKSTENVLKIKRQQAEWNAVKRGTVQHEILEGDEAVAYHDGRYFKIQVNCRADAGTFEGAAPYALAVTLEIAPEIQLPIYEEVRARIQAPVTIKP